MQARTAFRKAFISGESFSSDSISELAAGEYDLLLVASSWDSRSISIVAASEVQAQLGLGVFCEARDTQGLRDRHDVALSEYGRSKCRRFEHVEGSSTHVDAIWLQLKRHIADLHHKKGSPLKVLIDLSACPRYFSLGVVALCLTQRFTSNIRVLYAEGRYPASDHQLEYAFTGGRWKIAAIPYLEGICDPGKDRFYLVSVGFEGRRTLRAVSQADPDRVSALFPDPGGTPEYVKRTERNNAQLLRQFRVPPEQVIRVHSADAMEAWKTLDNAAIDIRSTENPYYLCSGTKPHALALALRALALESPAVLYNIPEEHKVHATTPSGTFWRFDIRDVSALA